MYQLSLFSSLAAVVIQFIAAILALLSLPRAGRVWLPWAAFTLALVLMIPRRWNPLELALHTGLYDFPQSLLGLSVSLLMLLAILGFRPLLRKAAPDQILKE